MAASRPIVLCISGIDPIGAAGLQAEVEVLHRLGVHALSLVTALTVQDTVNVSAVIPTPVATLAAQWSALQADGIHPQAVKVGLVADAAQARWIAALLDSLGVPVVVDPILKAGGGTTLASRSVLAPILMQATLLTPNLDEALALLDRPVDRDALAGAVRAQWSAEAVLVTGGDAADDAAVWHGFADAQGGLEMRHPRLAGGFRGAGCTLSATLAGHLAMGRSPREATPLALASTRAALSQGWALGRGRQVPGR